MQKKNPFLLATCDWYQFFFLQNGHFWVLGGIFYFFNLNLYDFNLLPLGSEYVILHIILLLKVYHHLYISITFADPLLRYSTSSDHSTLANQSAAFIASRDKPHDHHVTSDQSGSRMSCHSNLSQIGDISSPERETTV